MEDARVTRIGPKMEAWGSKKGMLIIVLNRKQYKIAHQMTNE